MNITIKEGVPVEEWISFNIELENFSGHETLNLVNFAEVSNFFSPSLNNFSPPGEKNAKKARNICTVILLNHSKLYILS